MRLARSEVGVNRLLLDAFVGDEKAPVIGLQAGSLLRKIVHQLMKPVSSTDVLLCVRTCRDCYNSIVL